MIFGQRKKRRIAGYDEQDLYTSWRDVTFWKPHQRKSIKRRTHKRERREVKSDLQKESLE